MVVEVTDLLENPAYKKVIETFFEVWDIGKIIKYESICPCIC